MDSIDAYVPEPDLSGDECHHLDYGIPSPIGGRTIADQIDSCLEVLLLRAQLTECFLPWRVTLTHEELGSENYAAASWAAQLATELCTDRSRVRVDETLGKGSFKKGRFSACITTS